MNTRNTSKQAELHEWPSAAPRGGWLGGSLIALIVTALSFAGCGGSATKADQPTVAATKPVSVSVQVDGSAPDHNEMFHHFSPDAVTVHPGDTVSFALRDSGEPHTVSFGNFADPVFQFIDQNCPDGYGKPPCNDSGPLELRAKISILIHENFPALLGDSDVHAGPANPCFLESGTLPADTRCPVVAQPKFTGREAVYSSGWLGPDKNYTVQLADDLKPGTYRFVCLVHQLEMVETVTVVDKAEAAQSAAEAKKNGQAQLNRMAESSRPAAEQLEATNDGATVNAGAWPGGGVHINEFGPATLSIPVGGTVTWKSQGGHTISFNATEGAKGARAVAADGSIHVNQKAITPSGMPAQAPPSDPNAPPPLDGGTWDGQGFFSTGFLNNPFTFRLTFSKPGTYTYKCLIHDNMEGTIKVGS